MHELGVVYSMLETVEGVAAEQKLTEISKIVLDIGEVSTVLPELLDDCWKYVRKKNPLIEGAELIINRTEAVTVCNDCGKTYPTLKYKKICPYCSSENTCLLSGNEFFIREIEAR